MIHFFLVPKATNDLLTTEITTPSAGHVGAVNSVNEAVISAPSAGQMVLRKSTDSVSCHTSGEKWGR